MQARRGYHRERTCHLTNAPSAAHMRGREQAELTRESYGEGTMGKGRIFSIATAAVVVLNLGVVTTSGADAAQGGGNDLCVAVSGGTVQNATVLDVAANGGTAIGDASGGNGNLAITANGGNDNNHDNGNNGNGNNNNHNGNGHNGNDDNGHNNKNDWSAQPLDVLAQRLLQTDTASSGNGGVATASGNGGVVSIGDVNSGGNAGNAISVGDTSCPGAVNTTSGGGNAHAPSGNTGGGNAGSGNNGGGGGRGGKVKALPKTGVGELGGGATGSLILALGALGMMGLS